MQKRFSTQETDNYKVLKIRHFVMDQIYRNPNVSIPIPSSRELEKSFGIPRALIRKALDKLRQEGYLATKPRFGCFTVPSKGWFRFAGFQNTEKLIGLLIDSGNNYFYQWNKWHVLAVLGEKAGRIGNLRLLTLSGLSEKSIAEEIENSRIDALIWQSSKIPKGVLSRLRKKEIPVVLCGRNQQGEYADAVVPDRAEAFQRIAEILIREKRRELLGLLFEKEHIAELETIRALCREKGAELSLTILSPNGPDFQERLNLYFRLNTPDMIAVRGNGIGAAKSILEKFAPDRRVLCSFLLLEHYYPVKEFHGIRLCHDLSAIAETATELVEKRLKNFSRPFETIRIPDRLEFFP